MSEEVFETPDTDATFQPYGPVRSRGVSDYGRAGEIGPHMSESSPQAPFENEIDASNVAASRAFEVFMGKVYKPSRSEYETTSTVSSTNYAASEFESPLAKFTRLSSEVQELQADLELLSLQNTKSTHPNAAQGVENKEILQGLETLQATLKSMQESSSYQPYLASHQDGSNMGAVLSAQRQLTSRFFDHIQKARDARTGEVKTDQKANIVYEIYSSGEVKEVDANTQARTIALERRIESLEKALGCTSDPSNMPLKGDAYSQLKALESKVELMDTQSLDAIKTRTTALNHEFSMLEKMKESEGVRNALESTEEKQQLRETFAKIKDLEETMHTVPALMDRLMSLKDAHDGSIDIVDRIQKMESEQESISSLLEDDKSMLEKVESSLDENIERFEKNLEHLDKRMSALLNDS